MMFLFAGHFAGLLNNNHVQLKLPWLLESQLHGSRRKSYLSVPFFIHLRYEWLVRGRLYMPNLRCESHHRICNLRYGMSTYRVTSKLNLHPRNKSITNSLNDFLQSQIGLQVWLNLTKRNWPSWDSVKWPMKKLSKRKRLRWTLKTVDLLGCGSPPPPLTVRKRTAVG